MKTQEFNEIMARIYGASQELDNLYCESEGEVTEQTENLEAEIEAMKQLLAGDGIDELGRRMTRFQHNIEDLKAERDHINASIKHFERLIDRTKYLAGAALRLLGEDKVKGTLGYSFTQYTSVKTKVDEAEVRDIFDEIVEKAVREAGVPQWVTYKLSANVSLVPEGAKLPGYFSQETTETAKFGKPRSAND